MTLQTAICHPQDWPLLGGGQRDGGWDGSGRPQLRLAILPGAIHYDIFSRPELAATALRFLDSPMTVVGSS